MIGSLVSVGPMPHQLVVLYSTPPLICSVVRTVVSHQLYEIIICRICFGAFPFYPLLAITYALAAVLPSGYEDVAVSPIQTPKASYTQRRH